MAIARKAPLVVRQLLDYLPKGQALPDDAWRARHRTLTGLLRVHVVVIFAFGLIRGESVLHASVEAGIIAAFAVLATAFQANRKVSSGVAAVGLVTCSAVLVHLSGGIIEMHFHFFVMVGILTLYQHWLPFLLAIGFVVIHHAGFGVMAPGEVYNHPAAIAHPFRWALIHGAFVLAASVASVVAWRLNEEQALKDSLTRLANRTLFQDRVAHALARSQRHPSSMAVLFIDLDEFKNVNDSLGHAAGDQLLTIVADRLRGSLRPTDTAARLGGDEFAVLVEDMASSEDAVLVAQRLLEVLSLPFVVRGKELTVGASIGIAVNGAHADVDGLLRDADVAMYSAKNGGRGRLEVFRSGMHDAVVQRVELAADLGRAVSHGELVLHYQPLVSLATGRLAGLEALLRWNHPRLGLLGPGQFMEVAEETGAIVPIGAWVVDEACRQTRLWRDRHSSLPFTMAVNVSPKQLHDGSIVPTVDAALRRHRLDPSLLVLELTEGVMLNDSELTVGRLHELKALGVQLAIDDFGTGYSSLSYLRRLPFDTLKIDKLFVDGITSGATESAFALAIIKLAQTLGLETVAEGVEEPDQVAHLRALGCELAQGYHFAKPLPLEAVDALLGAMARDGWAAPPGLRLPALSSGTSGDLPATGTMAVAAPEVVSGP